MASLEELVQQALMERAEQDRKHAEGLADIKRNEGTKLTRDLEAAFEKEFTPEVLALLPPLTYEVNQQAQYIQSRFAFLTMEYAQITWTISYTKGASWHISAQCWGHSINVRVDPGELQKNLLFYMGEEMQNLQKRRARDAALEAHDAEERRARQQKEEQERRERGKALRESIAEHERLQAQWDSMLAIAKKDLWQWPEGASVTFYDVSYQTGYSYDEGETRIEHGEGYTSEVGLREGWVTLMPTRVSWGARVKAEKRLFLSMERHLPIWEEKTFHSIDELPEELTQQVLLEFSGVTLSCYDAEDRIYPDQQRRFRPGFPDDSYTEVIGVVPLAWIRALIDQQAK